MKEHFDYIDTAKGICILFVVFWHVCQKCSINFEINYILSSFRMPLYFILSGLFFKTYSGFSDFLKRKINKLLIPFVFFYLLISIAFLNILVSIGDTSVLQYENLFDEGFISLFSVWEEFFFNKPIWFLLCLFEINILFYFLYSCFFNINKFLFCSATIIISLLGWYLSYKSVNLPLYLDTSLTNILFFGVGFYLRNYTSFLKYNQYDKYNPYLIFLCFMYVCINYQNVHFRPNDVSMTNPFNLYLCGSLGTIGIILLCKKINRLPIVTFLGKYSIMTLCTHTITIRFSYALFHMFTENSILLVVLTMMSTAIISYFTIPLLLKYIPYFTAQKDLL